MAVKEFNMNKIKRTFWPFTLKDKKDENGNVVEKGKKIIVRMPQKGVFEAIKDVEANGTGEDADTSTIYNLVAAVLNNNMGNVKVSAEEVESYDIEECTARVHCLYTQSFRPMPGNPKRLYDATIY